MLNVPQEVLSVLAFFTPLFSARVWLSAEVLFLGAILAPNVRTVASCLRVMGLKDEQRFCNYHRVLSRAKWNTLAAAKILLGLLIHCIPVAMPLIIAVDETIERRKGEKIKAKGCYRDAVRSTEKVVVKCFGLKWISMMLIVILP
jgi:hypothetical protein